MYEDENNGLLWTIQPRKFDCFGSAETDEVVNVQSQEATLSSSQASQHLGSLSTTQTNLNRQWSALTNQALRQVEEARRLSEQQQQQLQEVAHKKWLMGVQQQQMQQEQRQQQQWKIGKEWLDHPMAQQQAFYVATWTEDGGGAEAAALRAAAEQLQEPQQPQLSPESSGQQEQMAPASSSHKEMLQQQQLHLQQPQQQQPVQGLHKVNVTVNIGNQAFQAIQTVHQTSEGTPAALNIWDIPMTRQLEMARWNEPLPNFVVGKGTMDTGAWMAFFWNLQTCLGQQYVLFTSFDVQESCCDVVVVW